MISSGFLISRFPPLALALMLCVVALLGCTEEKTVPTLPGAHPDDWMAVGSPDFHGRVVTVSGVSGCRKCHGVDFTGGVSGISCVDCHLSLAGFCVTCHGGLHDQSGAPPYALNGDSAVSSPGVGAHQAHLSPGSPSSGFPCATCHMVPAFVFQANHYDSVSADGLLIADSIAEITWGNLAGPNAVWNRATASCASTYCHGNFAGGHVTNSPVWTSSGQAECGSCHDVGADPASLGWKHDFHVRVYGLECRDCHSEVVDADLRIIGLVLHVNGVADTLARDAAICEVCHGPNASCTACHGGIDNNTGAPPTGLDGEVSTSSLAVGAHTVHLEDGSLAGGFACSVCHIVPYDVASPGHLGSDSIAEVTFDGLSGSSSSWNRSTARCSGTYCHGNFDGGYSSNAPLWTSGTAAACGSCHDVGSTPRDLGGQHDRHVREENIGCYRCHSTVVNSGGAIIGRNLHVDGTNQVHFSIGGGIYSNGRCSGMGCHGPEYWLGD